MVMTRRRGSEAAATAATDSPLRPLGTPHTSQLTTHTYLILQDVSFIGDKSALLSRGTELLELPLLVPLLVPLLPPADGAVVSW